MTTPIHLDDFPWVPKDQRKDLARMECSCVYVLGPLSGNLKVTATLNPLLHFSDARQWLFDDALYLHGFVWVQGNMAKRLEKECHTILDAGNRRHSGSWFTILSQEVDGILKAASKGSGVSIVSHTDMMLAVERSYRSRIENQIRKAGALD